MKRSSGFTLLELLVSIGLLALLVLTLSMVFSQGLKALHVGYNRAEMYASARAALEQMIREIPTALCDGSAGYPLSGYSSPRFRAGSSGPEIYFIGQVSGAGQCEVVKLGYWLKKDAGANTGELMRYYVTDDAAGFDLYTSPFQPQFTAGNSNALAQNITALTLSYYFRNSMTDPKIFTQTQTWDSTSNAAANLDAEGNTKNPDGLPDAVEVSITVQDKLLKERPKTLTVYIPLET